MLPTTRRRNHYGCVAKSADRITYKGTIVNVDPGDAVSTVADADIGIWKPLDQFEPSSPSKLWPVLYQRSLAILTTRREDNQASFEIVGCVIGENVPRQDAGSRLSA
jgi:hypothetical protein